MSLTPVESREEDEQQRGDNHNLNEEKEIVCAVQVERLSLNQKIHAGGKDVTE
jgi:hypothetical protein